jgi:hypothetical protein
MQQKRNTQAPGLLRFFLFFRFSTLRYPALFSYVPIRICPIIGMVCRMRETGIKKLSRTKVCGYMFGVRVYTKRPNV